MRRKRWRLPDSAPHSQQREEAQRAVLAAAVRLADAIKRGPEVTDRARKLEKIHRENNLGPRISAALGVHSG